MVIDKKVLELNQCITAYEKHYYETECKLESQYFPKRIMELEGSGADQKSILDLGMGDGYSVLYFSEIVKDYTVIEGSEAIITKFKKENLNCSTNILSVLFEQYVTDKQFDIIIMGCILEHVDNPLQILQYYKKYLNLMGKCIYQCLIGNLYTKKLLFLQE